MLPRHQGLSENRPAGACLRGLPNGSHECGRPKGAPLHDAEIFAAGPGGARTSSGGFAGYPANTRAGVLSSRDEATRIGVVLNSNQQEICNRDKSE